MNAGIFSKVILDIVESQSEKKSESYAMMNVRPGEKVAAMLDVIAYLHKKSPSVVIADLLSKKLADYAASSLDHADAILKSTAQAISDYGHPNENSAIGILEKKGLINIRTRFTRDFDKNPL